MEYLAKVKRSSYKGIAQDKVIVNMQKILENVTGKAEYEMVNTEIAAMQTQRDIFAAALARAKDGGKTLTQQKDIEKKKFIKSIDALVDALEFYAKGDVSFLIPTGFTLQAKKTQTKGTRKPIAIPSNILIVPTIVPGQVKVSFKLDDPNRVTNVAARYRVVGTEGKTNGTYFSGQKGLMTNLPSGKNVEVELCAIGRGEQMSNWSVPFTVPVL